MIHPFNIKWCYAFLLSAYWSSVGCAADTVATPSREFEVLVIPPISIRRPLAEIRPGVVEASLDGKPLNVVGVEKRSYLDDSPLVIVIDSAGTPVRLDRRLFDVARHVHSSLRPRQMSLLLVTGCDVSRTFDYLRFYSQSLVAVLKDQLHTMLPADTECGDFVEGVSDLDGARLGVAGPRESMRGICSWLPREAGPVRVLWVSGDFKWYDLRLKYESDNSPSPAVGRTAFSGIEEFLSERSVTVFPVILLEPGRHAGQFKKPDSWNLASARYLASTTGGFVGLADDNPGKTLDDFLHATDEHYVVTLAGPVTGRRLNSEARTLNVAFHDPRESFAITRSFVVNPPGAIQRDPRVFESACPRIVIPRADLRVDLGCPGATSNEKDRRIGLLFPDYVARAPKGKMLAQVEYLRPNAVLRTERHMIDREPGSTPCINLRYAENGDEVRLVVLDAQTGWVGALSGRTTVSHEPAAKIERK